MTIYQKMEDNDNSNLSQEEWDKSMKTLMESHFGKSIKYYTFANIVKNYKSWKKQKTLVLN